MVQRSCRRRYPRVLTHAVPTRRSSDLDGSNGASRAVHDSMPILPAANQVLVFGGDPAKASGTPGAELARHLVRHDVKVEAAHTVANDIEIGEALLSATADRGIDLLVMGAYGHARLRAMGFGGVPETIMRTMTN